jgi:hypothetical protein
MKQRYEIIIHGSLSHEWAVIFNGMEVICLPNGNTLINGVLPDQAALYGLLMQLRDLGMTLISVNLDKEMP